jgi:hypothetical protein
MLESLRRTHHVLTDRIDGEEKIVAVFTILASEVAALRQYGELVEIGGKHPDLHLKQEAIPLTGLNHG